MQYVGRAIGSISMTWSSINPATLSGAIDVIVVEHPAGHLACSPFHVRFGKFQILKPSQKKVEVIVNGQTTDIPMKLGDSGEAYFVFETNTDVSEIPNELIASPVVSPASSPELSPKYDLNGETKLEEPSFLDINNSDSSFGIYRPNTPIQLLKHDDIPQLSFEQRMNKKFTQKKIPSKIDNNGDLLLDIEGYKPSDEKVHDTDELIKQLLHDELGSDYNISTFIKEDDNGSIRIVNPFDSNPTQSPPPTSTMGGSPLHSLDSNQSIIRDNHIELPHSTDNSNSSSNKNYIKTIRLSSDQLRCLDLKYGENDLTFSVDKRKAIVTSKLFLWKWDIPIVISDIDGTITKSDALGHVLTMIGKDWTHSGVAKLFTEIKRNGYNIMYLTARSAGQADSTRSYLRSILQDGCKLPLGPVILSPDRTIAALKREVILKKPEVFKIACLNDMRKLYFQDLNSHEINDELPTPFIAGFGNRITDALSYRTVGIPSSRIFTINPDGEVHMELLELAGYKSSYIHINELVDHFFPPVRYGYDKDEDLRSVPSTPASPVGTVLDNHERTLYRKIDEKFTDFNFWRDPLLNLDNLSDISNDTYEYIMDDEMVDNRSPVKVKKNKLDRLQSPERITTSHFNEINDFHDSPTSFLDNTERDISSEFESLPKLSTLNFSNSHKLELSMNKLSIFQSCEPTSEVSKINVFDNGRNNQVTENSDDQIEDGYTDDEFDEDEFVG